MLYEHYLDLAAELNDAIRAMETHEDERVREHAIGRHSSRSSSYGSGVARRPSLSRRPAGRSEMSRTLIAGFGNVLRGDDGFGVEVIRRLEGVSLGNGVQLLEVGTGGFHLAHELLGIYDRLVIVDAMTRGEPPGSLYIVEVTDVNVVPTVDMHSTVPAQALGWAKALGVLPPHVVIVGCEPGRVDDLSTVLSDPVAAAADIAVRRIGELLAEQSTHA